MLPLSIIGIIASVVTFYMGMRLLLNTPAVGAGIIFCVLAFFFFGFSVVVLMNSRKRKQESPPQG